MGKTAFGTFFRNLEKALCYVPLVLMALLPVADVLLGLFNLAIPYSRPLLVRLFLLAGLFAATLTTQAKEHISIAIIQYAKNEKAKAVLSVITNLVSTFVITILFWDSISFIKYSLQGQGIWIIPDRFFALAMPVAYGIIAFRFARNLIAGTAKSSGGTGEGEKQKSQWLRKMQWIIPVLVLLLGTAAALPAVVKIIWGIEG